MPDTTPEAKAARSLLNKADAHRETVGMSKGEAARAAGMSRADDWSRLMRPGGPVPKLDRCVAVFTAVGLRFELVEE